MAKQHENGRITGTLGDRTFYKAKGSYYVRRKGGVSKERILKDPNFARVRENMSEFQNAGTTAKELRRALRKLAEKTSDSNLTSRLVRVLMQVIKSDPSNPRGQRTVADGDINLLKGFEFNLTSKLSEKLIGFLNQSINRAGSQVSLSGNLVPGSDLVIPESATHYKISNVALVIDLNDPQVHEVAIISSNESPIDMENDPVDLNTAFSIDPTGKVIFQLVLLEFYQEVNGIYYDLRSSNALQIVGIDR